MSMMTGDRTLRERVMRRNPGVASWFMRRKPAIRSVDEFMKVLMDRGIDPATMNPAKILSSSLFTGPHAFKIAPQVWKEVQGALANLQVAHQPGGTEALATSPDAAGSGGGGGVGTVQTGTSTVPSPVLEVMGEMRARREASRQAAQNQLAGLLTAVPQFAPKGATFYPGFEHGGLADIMMGILSGKGIEGARSLIPESTRQPGTVPVPGSLFAAIGAAEPSAESDFGAASSLAAQILGQYLQIPQYSAFSTGGGGGGGSGGGASGASEEDIGLEFLNQMLGGA